MTPTKPQHTPGRTQPCLEQWLLMSDNVRDEYRREGFYDPSALIDPLPLLKQRDALAEALQEAAIELQIAGERLRDPSLQEKAAKARAALAAAGLTGGGK